MRLSLIFFAVLSAPAVSFCQQAESPGEKFRIPVWHPEARWKLDPKPYAFDTNCRAHLDGPRHEALCVHGVYPRFFGGFDGGGRYVFMTCCERTGRVHAATAGAAGYLDGPFSRARFYVSDYHECRHERAWSPDKRFFYMLAGFYDQRIRALDFAEQQVRTLPVKGVVFACGESGKLYVVQGFNPAAKVVVVGPGPAWKVLRVVGLKGDVRLSGLGCSAAVDEKHGRLYCTTYRAARHYVWYWDLKDGSYHGVLPNCEKKPGARKMGEAGPFEGSVLYNHGEISWGPDDPEKRFLYVTRVDDNNLYRLDLKRRIMAVFSVKRGRFVESGKGDGQPLYMYPPYWLPDGSFVGIVPWYQRPPQYKFFKRIR